MNKNTHKESATEIQNIWKMLSKENGSIENSQFELEIHRKLLNVFQVGEFYYIVLDLHKGEFIHVSNHAEAVLGIKTNEFTIGSLMEFIHPDDLPYFLNFEHSVALFFKNLPIDKLTKYKTRYDYRIRKKNGEYIRILQQVVVLEQDSDGLVLKSLCVHTDISHLKDSGKPILSIIGSDGEPSYIDIDVDQKYEANSFFSKREKEVLDLLIKGKISKEIAVELSLSILTVSTYRRNILKKAKTASTAELIAKAIKEGWV